MLVRMLLSTVILVVAGCTVPQSTEITTSGAAKDRKEQIRPNGQSSSEIEYRRANRTTMPVSLDEARIGETFQVNTDVLSYQFSYLSTQKDGPINFVDGVAQLVFNDLEINNSGTLTLIILEAGKPQVKGEIPNLTLLPGANAQKIRLVKIDGSQSEDFNIGNNQQQTAVTYQMVKPILDAKCVRCHSQQGTAKGNVLLASFPFTITNSQKFSSTGSLMARLIDTIENPNSTMPMPRGGDKLSPAEIDLIKKWNAEGLKP